MRFLFTCLLASALLVLWIEAAPTTTTISSKSVETDEKKPIGDKKDDKKSGEEGTDEETETSGDKKVTDKPDKDEGTTKPSIDEHTNGVETTTQSVTPTQGSTTTTGPVKTTHGKFLIILRLLK